MIATLVFSTVLLLCATGLITIGRHYQKGITSRQTQEAARNLADQIKNDFVFGGGDFKKLLGGTGGVEAFCIGDNVYVYQKDVPVSLTPETHALLLKRPNTGCPADASALTMTMTDNAKEFLGSRMSLGEFKVDGIVAPGTARVTSISISINVVAGESDLLTASGLGRSCKGGAGQEFCASSTIVSYATRRL